MVGTGLEGGDFFKVLLRETRGNGFRLSRYADYLQEVEGAATLDARSVFDFLKRIPESCPQLAGWLWILD